MTNVVQLDLRRPHRTLQAEILWRAMPRDLRIVLRHKLSHLGPGGMTTELGRHWTAGQWSLTPYPHSEEFGLDASVAAELVERLRRGDD
ncbi:hypothetical protein [Mameliella sediminis]|uniref:hypothetical protein n=1 Tax=Mameliella sediminis TaxID=2836866 RepID=UPI001C485A4A|nr:hypothetical protein [Mameliella sediminis]MBY6115343.1 hypothetical protein [Antarctobacter heliothermus]MBY6144592.1 hypothetical protein [Mameliella alba]MBV7395706.1 hypothetical protein [Mameliella sediminis]MBY6160119.1 hypothetical protein [Mameliella alba]MBY6168589.1 hypothetical protein [Mameliella alba]